MKPYNIKSYLTISALALVISACSDSTYEGAADGDVTEVTRLRLSVGAGVSISPAEGTRSTNLEFQNGTFAEGTEIGMFIMQGATFQNYVERAQAYRDSLNGADSSELLLPSSDADVPAAYMSSLLAGGDADMSRMVAAAYADGKTYGYENVKAGIDADGTIRMADGTDFIYPLHMSDRVSIVAYAPYSDTLTYAHLIKGMPVCTDTAQHTDEGLRQSDMLVGIPEQGNPFREREEVAVSLGFSHIMTSIQMFISMTNSEELRSDSIIVTMKGVATADTMLLPATAVTLQEGGKGEFVGNATDTTDVVLARMAGLGARDGGSQVTLACNAIIVPQKFAEGTHPTFEITLKGRPDGLADTTIVRADMRDGVVLRSGKMNIYRTSIPTVSSGDDGDPDETLPDEGKDDIVLGAPKRD